jgi:hypothetical protein
MRISTANAASLTMLGLGAAALLSSVFYTSTILAIIGLGLAFWGALLLYIRNPEYIQKDLLDASIQPSLETINQIMQELAYEGKAIYLPPKYFENPETTKIYITEQKDSNLPTQEEIQKNEKQLLIEDSKGNPQGLLLTPPGAELSKLFEKTLETNFTKVDLQYLQQNMPKLIIEDLEIAQNFEIEAINNKVHVKLENSPYTSLLKDTKNPSNLCILGCLISSAIACTLTKATSKPIIIENQHTSKDDKDIEIEYQILEEENR